MESVSREIHLHSHPLLTQMSKNKASKMPLTGTLHIHFNMQEAKVCVSVCHCLCVCVCVMNGTAQGSPHSRAITSIFFLIVSSLFSIRLSPSFPFFFSISPLYTISALPLILIPSAHLPILLFKMGHVSPPQDAAD